MTEEDIARVAHEVNRAYCEAIGDWDQSPWDIADEWQKESAISGVRFHLSGDHNPEESHDTWWLEKKKDGWVWGPKKDPSKKEHPCCVPFDDLPDEQRAKDYIFRAVVHALRGEIQK